MLIFVSECQQYNFYVHCVQKAKLFKGALSGLRQFLATERPLRFYFKSSFHSRDI